MADAALCAFAEKLTLHPARMEEADVIDLRRSGFGDADVHHAIQVVSYFNYINRIAEAVGIGPEPEWEER